MNAVKLRTKKRKWVSNTWLDRKGNSYDIHLENKHPRKTLGLRINVHTWLDNGECHIKLIDGAGNSIHWKEHERIILDNPTDEEVDKVVEEMTERAKLVSDTFHTQGIDWSNW